MSRTAIAITAGVKKAQRLPVSVKRKKGQPAGRPVGRNRLTANEKAYADAVEMAWTLIPSRTIQDQWLSKDPGKILGGVVDAITPYQEFLSELTLFQVDQSGILVFNEIKTNVAADLKKLEKTTHRTPTSLSATALAMNFNTASPAATQYANMSAGNMVRDMIDSQVKSVRSVIGRAFNDGLTRQQTSRNLVQVLNEIPTPAFPFLAATGGVAPGNYALSVVFGDATKGLTTRYATAVYNRADKLVRQNPKITAAELKRKSDRYGSKLRRSRARTIARTEIMRASNQGRLQGMVQAADAGLVNPISARKQWVTSRFDVCEICVPLNGRTIKIKESFGAPGLAPPAHPNCRCTIRMLPDPSTYGLPTSTGTGQAGSPLQFVRPKKPGMKIQEIVHPLSRLPKPLAPVPRAGNFSAGFDVPTSKVAQEAVGAVIQTMDDAGYVLQNALPSGNVQVRMLKATDKGKLRGQRGSFTPLTKKKRPSYPGRNASAEKLEAYEVKAKEWAANPGESVIVVRTGPDLSLGSMQNTATHEIGHRIDRIVKENVGNKMDPYIGIQGEYSKETIASAQRAMRIPTDFDFRGNAQVGGDAISANERFQRLKFSDLTDGNEASEAFLNFFQAVGRSDALQEIRDMAVGIGSNTWARYATSPNEIWARAFNQWHTMKHGTIDAVEDMLFKTGKPKWSDVADSRNSLEDGWYGAQWRPQEFDELVSPHVEKVLKHLGVIE